MDDHVSNLNGEYEFKEGIEGCNIFSQHLPFFDKVFENTLSYRLLLKILYRRAKFKNLLLFRLIHPPLFRSIHPPLWEVNSPEVWHPTGNV